MTTPATPVLPVGTRAPAQRKQRKWTIVRWASPVVLLALWQLGSALGIISQDVLPAPSLIAEAGLDSSAHGNVLGQLDKAGLTPADVKSQHR